VKIMILGAGVQGTLYAVRLARAGHDVTLIARGARAAELHAQGAVIEELLSGRSGFATFPWAAANAGLRVSEVSRKISDELRVFLL
jgi:ketopantoate reductase